MGSPCIGCLVRSMCQKSCQEFFNYVSKELLSYDIKDLREDFYSEVCCEMRGRKDKFKLAYTIMEDLQDDVGIETDIYFDNGVISKVRFHG